MKQSKINLFYLKPTHALFCKIHSHSHLKLQTVKNVCETETETGRVFNSLKF